MTRLSEFEKAAVFVGKLRRIRTFRSYFEAQDSVTCSFDAVGKPADVTLSRAARDDFAKALAAEERSILEQLRAYDVKIDEDLP